MRAGGHRIGFTVGGELEGTAVEHRRGPRGPQSGLGRGLRPTAQIEFVSMRPAQRLTGLVAGRRNTGQIDQRCEWIGHTRNASRPLNAISPTVRRRTGTARQPPCEVPTSLQPSVTRLTPMSNAPATSYRCSDSLSAACRFRGQRQRDARVVRRGREGPAGVLGRPGQPADVADPVHARCSTGRRHRSRSGSSAASSTSPTTASTVTSRPATAIGWRSTGRASRSATPATSPTPSSRTRSARPPMR